MKLRELQDKVAEKLSRVPPTATLTRTLVDDIVQFTIEEQGFSIARDGEIVDPRPAPAANSWTAPGDNSRYRGRRRR